MSLVAKRPLAQQPKSLPSSTDTSAAPSSKPKANDGTVKDLDPAAERIANDTTPLQPADFYELMGMQAPDAHGKSPRKVYTEHGFYSSVRQRERRVSQSYWAYDLIVNALLLMQIILSAVFIVLGSVNSIHRITITVLGALSTLIVSILAMLKGQGLPNRLRMERNSFRMVLFQADELYWDVGASKPVTYGDIKKVREAYLRAVQDAAKNHPDSWNVTAASVGQGLAPGAMPSKNMSAAVPATMPQIPPNAKM